MEVCGRELSWSVPPVKLHEEGFIDLVN